MAELKAEAPANVTVVPGEVTTAEIPVVICGVANCTRLLVSPRLNVIVRKILPVSEPVLVIWTAKISPAANATVLVGSEQEVAAFVIEHVMPVGAPFLITEKVKVLFALPGDELRVTLNGLPAVPPPPIDGAMISQVPGFVVRVGEHAANIELYLVELTVVV